MNRRLLAIIIAGLVALCGHAETHYVVTNNPVNPSGIDPYTSWETAGTNLIDVVTAALTNTEPRTVTVSNGAYYLTNQVYINGALTMESVNGRGKTFVDGGGEAQTNRCFYINHASAVVSGFTISNGGNNGLYGGGVYINAGKLAGCLVTMNIATNGGGVYNNGTVQDCVISNNRAILYGGGVYTLKDVLNSTICYSTVTNDTDDQNSNGGGIYAGSSAVISNCVVNNNISWPKVSGRGFGGGINGGKVYNSLIIHNYASGYGGGTAWARALVNCTVVSNYANASVGGVYEMQSVYVLNSIVYFNTAKNTYSNYWQTTDRSPVASNCCIAPLTYLVPEKCTNNIDSNPLFVDFNNGDYRLAADSPCINAGTNLIFTTGDADLDGNARIRYGTIDMGAFENIYQGALYQIP